MKLAVKLLMELAAVLMKMPPVVLMVSIVAPVAIPVVKDTVQEAPPTGSWIS
jgi:hypothetical protein